MRFIVTVIGVLVLGVAPAWACPETSLKTAADLFAQIKSSANPAKLSSDMDAVAAACPADPFVLKLAAMTKNNLANAAEPAARFKLRGEAWTTWRKATGARVAGQPNAKMIAGYGEVSFNDSYEFEKALLYSLLAEEQRTGNVVAEHAPFRKGDPTPACPQDWDIVAAHVRFFINDHGYVDGGLNFLDRAVAACEAGIAAKNDRNILAARAIVLMRGGEQGKGPADALDRAYDDATRFIALGDYSLAWWDESDDRKLRELMVAQAIRSGGKPEADWFKPENLKKLGAYTSIALALDKAWAESEAAGGASAGAYKIYRDVVTAQFNRAKADANADGARFTLAQGAKMHALGSVRRPENETLPAPPTYLWNWIHADVKP